MNLFDTISAVSTPYGKGGVALIRISGEDALAVADKIFRSKGGKMLSECAERRAVYGYVYPADAKEGARAVDDVMAVYMKAPATYTGEDTVEICCHGGILITRAVLAETLRAGARPAEAGEYTRRAFVNGRISLTEAESLGLLLEAKTDAQMKLFRSGMNGRLREKITEIYESLCAVESSIFAVIDYPDEDLADMSRDEMVAALDGIREGLDALRGTFVTGKAISEAIPAVICGRTNAGKSSLYNLMVGYDAAIVTDIEGTTRDILREEVALGKLLIRLSDTAGLRESDDVVESIGIRKAIEEMESAGIIFGVFDGSKPLEKEDERLLSEIESRGGSALRLAVINKSDLGLGITEENMARIERVFTSVHKISAINGEGFSDLAKAAEDAFINGELDLAEDAIIINARQMSAVENALTSVCAALSGISAGLEIDMCCDDIEDAMRALGELDGRQVSEDIVGAIFSRFCVGK